MIFGSREMPINKPYFAEKPKVKHQESKESPESQDDSEKEKYISPLKQSVLRKNESITEEKVNGNVMMACHNYKKDFRVKYCMTSHSYTSNIEALFSVSIDQVTRIIEQSDNIYNS